MRDHRSRPGLNERLGQTEDVCGLDVVEGREGLASVRESEQARGDAGWLRGHEDSRRVRELLCLPRSERRPLALGLARAEVES
jgi:hypothetical protein